MRKAGLTRTRCSSRCSPCRRPRRRRPRSRSAARPRSRRSPPSSPRRYLKARPGQGQVPHPPGRLRHRHRRRRARPRDDRQVVARPAAVRPGRPRLQQDRPRRRLHRHQPRQPRSATSRRTRSRRSSPAGPQLERGARAPRSTGPIDLIVRTAASGTQDAFQNIFMGQNCASRRAPARRPSNGLVQQAIESTRTRSATSTSTSPRGSHTVPYKGVACNLRNAKSGQYGGVRNFWLVTRGKATGAAAKFINLDRARARRARSSPRTGSR